MPEPERVRILYMEDDTDLARLFQRKLRSAGYAVDIASDGGEGLAMYAEGSYDVLAVDQNMPVHDGLEVIRILASQGSLPPTIMVTGAGNEQTAIQAMKLGVSDYIVKDVAGGYLGLLPTLIQQVLHQRQLAEDKRKAERALEESEERYRLLVEDAPLGIISIDPQGQINKVNHALLNLPGFLSADEIDRTDILRSGTFIESGIADKFRICLESGETRVSEHSYNNEESGRVYLRLHVSPTRSTDGNITGVQAIVENISEQKRLEERMRRRDRMEALGQLAGGIAHDFNNILTGITLSAQILQTHRYLPPDMASDLQNILDEAHRAARLVRQILDFSRQSFFETQPVDLGNLVQKVFELLQRTLPEKIHLLLDMGPEEFVVSADPARIEQVLTNLALNARDAMPAGGELRIGLSTIVVSPGEQAPVAEMPHGGWMCLSVSDSGVGIPPRAVPHLFEPFFTTKPVGQGSGMGLAQVHGIIKQHEGYIGVETQVGEGTTFRIYLPAQIVDAAEAVPQARTSGAPKPAREIILLAEDEEIVRKLGRRVLETLGYEVLTATNGRDALEIYRSAERVDLMLVDMMMPELGGRELMRQLRTTNPDLKGLIITGYALEENLRELRKEGILDVVHKPFTVDALAQAVRRALDAN